MKIPDNTKIQSVGLHVRDLEKSLHFYSGLIGFKEIRRSGSSIYLSATGKEPYLIKIEETKSSKPAPYNAAGLFHTAFRFPNRKELAREFIKLFDNKVKFQGFSDHIVSEAIYLSDPDGNGVELYADKPREYWKWANGEVEMATEPLNLADLVQELGGANRKNNDIEDKYEIHPDTDVGHIHLKVSELRKAERFYHEILGFNITTKSYEGALFFAAGDYHHHIGTNVWKSLNGPPVDENATGLAQFTIMIPDDGYQKEIIKRFKDSKINFEADNGDALIVRDFDNIKVKIATGLQIKKL